MSAEPGGEPVAHRRRAAEAEGAPPDGAASDPHAAGDVLPPLGHAVRARAMVCLDPEAADDGGELEGAAAARGGASKEGLATPVQRLPSYPAAQAKLVGETRDGRLSPQAEEECVSRAVTQVGEGSDGGSVSGAAAHVVGAPAVAVMPCEQTCAKGQGAGGAGGAVPGDGVLPSPAVKTTRRRLGDRICSLMARSDAWMYACFVAAASLGAAPRFLVLLACQAVPQVSMPEAVDFKTLWAPCKDPRNAFSAVSPNGALYHAMALSDQGLSMGGMTIAFIAALQLMYPTLCNTRGGRWCHALAVLCWS